MSDFQIVFVTASNEAEAKKISRTLVEERLAACVNLTPCQSVYRWRGELVDDTEVLMVIKARKRNFGRIEARVKELHSYEVPEVIAVDLADVAEGYRQFLEETP